jgi:5-hydroxyisourate hydrolase-like protein (transthyretin family)
MSSCAGVRVCFVLLFLLAGCVPEAEPLVDDGEEALSRTEFTDRLENFFEYTALRSGVPSAFLIHLTDLSDGTPVAEAQVELSVRPAGRDNEVASSTAQIGRVTGIYVAELSIPSPGTHDIEFRIRNDRLDERMILTDFQVEEQR